MRKAILILLALSICLISCADKGIITNIELAYVDNGEIIEKNYFPAHIHTESHYNYDTDKWETKTIHHSAQYEIKVKRYDDFTQKYYFGRFNTSESNFYIYNIGDYYGVKKQDENYYIRIKNEKKLTGYRMFKYHQIKNYKLGDYIIFDEVAK